MRIVAVPRAVDVRSSHQFEEEIGAASSENGLFIAVMEFSVQTGEPQKSRECGPRYEKDGGGICPMTVCTATPKPSNLLSFPGNASSSSPTGNP
jgi:hypothetical protein